jgi:hypothetical protein
MLRNVELILGFVGAFLCSAVALTFGMSQASISGGLWPLPGLIFLELILLSLLGLAAAARDAGSARSVWGYIPWVVTGALAALVVLGGFTIGFFLIPSLLCFLAVGLLGKSRWGIRLPLANGLAAAALVVQAAPLILPLMLSP